MRKCAKWCKSVKQGEFCDSVPKVEKSVPNAVKNEALYSKKECQMLKKSVKSLESVPKSETVCKKLVIVIFQVTFHPEKDISLSDVTNDAILVVHGTLSQSQSLRYGSLHWDESDTYISATTPKQRWS